MSIHTVALLAGLLAAPAWLVVIGHGLRHKNARTHAMFWGGVVGNTVGMVVACGALFAPPVMWQSVTRELLIHWPLLVGTIVGAVVGRLK